MKKKNRPLNARRGAVLIVALLLAAMIGISLTSYLRLSRTTLNLSNRSLYHNGAMNLAEQGLEEAMYSVNKAVADPTYTWTGWTPSSGDMRQEWTGINLSQNATASFRVYFFNYALANPAPKIIIARSRVTLGGVSGSAIEKWIQVDLRKRGKFANGLVAKDFVDFNGTNTSVDSWNSDDDNNPATPGVPYTAARRQANGSVASNAIVSVDNADIFGYVATGGAAPNVHHNQGMITGNLSATPPISPPADPGRVDTNFNAAFEPVVVPPGAYSYNGPITSGTSLPRSGIDTVMGTGDYAGYYMISADYVKFNNAALTITAKVILKLTHSSDAIDIGGGSGALNINAGAELQAYGSGAFKVAGNGILNGGTTLATANLPVACQFYGTKNSPSQTIDIKGNGILSALVYAPFGTVKINGNGDVCGSIVAQDITLVGNAIFHYDESLANYGVATPYRMGSWKELTTRADRTTTTAAAINW